MSLWVDKYRPTSLNKMDFHLPLSDKLKHLVASGDFPHLLFYGPSGAGKKTRVMALLRELYGNGVGKLRIEHKTFETPSKAKVELSMITSNYHVEINPGDAGIHDRIVVQEVLKEIAQTHQINAQVQREFKVVVLNEVDNLSKDAQHALRRTMEKYISTCRLILICNSSSKVIAPIQSRCLVLRVASPSTDDIVKVLSNVCKKEALNLPVKLAERITKETNGNIRQALLMLEACKVQQYPFDETQQLQVSDWMLYLKGTTRLILKDQSPKMLLVVRKRLYELLTHCISPTVIMRSLTDELTANLDDTLKTETVYWAAHYEHRMQLGQKEIFHLEAFVAKFMQIYKGYTLGLCLF